MHVQTTFTLNAVTPLYSETALDLGILKYFKLRTLKKRQYHTIKAKITKNNFFAFIKKKWYTIIQTIGQTINIFTRAIAKTKAKIMPKISTLYMRYIKKPMRKIKQYIQNWIFQYKRGIKLIDSGVRIRSQKIKKKTSHNNKRKMDVYFVGNFFMSVQTKNLKKKKRAAKINNLFSIQSEHLYYFYRRLINSGYTLHYSRTSAACIHENGSLIFKNILKKQRNLYKYRILRRIRYASRRPWLPPKLWKRELKKYWNRKNTVFARAYNYRLFHGRLFHKILPKISYTKLFTRKKSIALKQYNFALKKHLPKPGVYNLITCELNILFDELIFGASSDVPVTFRPGTSLAKNDLFNFMSLKRRLFVTFSEIKFGIIIRAQSPGGLKNCKMDLCSKLGVPFK